MTRRTAMLQEFFWEESLDSLSCDEKWRDAIYLNGEFSKFSSQCSRERVHSLVCHYSSGPGIEKAKSRPATRVGSAVKCDSGRSTAPSREPTGEISSTWPSWQTAIQIFPFGFFAPDQSIAIVLTAPIRLAAVSVHLRPLSADERSSGATPCSTGCHDFSPAATASTRGGLESISAPPLRRPASLCRL